MPSSTPTSNLAASTFSEPQVIVSGQLGTTDVALYTCPANQSARLGTGTLCNVTASAVVVYLSIVKSGGVVGDGTHRIISAYSLAANDTLSLRDYLAGHYLGPGDMVAAFAATASAVDAVLSAVVFS